MLGQSKTAFQAEIDSACELIDFLRFNVAFAERIYQEQPESAPGAWNRMDHRPLEGFVYAITPFNFTAIGGNLPTAPALMGNAVVWKPSSTAALSNWHFFRLLQEAGLPPGVINFVPGDAVEVSRVLLHDPGFAGIHFTGSTAVFQSLWKTIGENMARYRGYPRIVGETGGKDFILAHASADAEALAVGMVRGAYEYQGQKCSAASRAYIPDTLWPEVRDRVVAMIGQIRMGDVADFLDSSPASPTPIASSTGPVISSVVPLASVHNRPSMVSAEPTESARKNTQATQTSPNVLNTCSADTQSPSGTRASTPRSRSERFH